MGVDGREIDRVDGELRLAGICGLELGVDGLELCNGRDLSMEELVGAGRALDGVEGRDDAWREDGVEGLDIGVRPMGEDGLI